MAKRFAPRRLGAGEGIRLDKAGARYGKRMSLFVMLGVGAVFACLLFNYVTDADATGSGRALLGTKTCSGDTVLPIFPYEDTWQVWIRALIYLVFLGYLFLGVAISADTFMAAIEVITSKTQEVNIGSEKVEVEIWNATVANLTLMALGSSAPEILLAVVEICALKFEAGDLGPGTIVGSAAFNLLFITAICISSLPETEDDPDQLETREIEEFGVFVITAIASLFAYLWMVIVLAWVSTDEVEVWEALLTLIYFPILVWVSWAQDSGWWGFFGAEKVSPEEEENKGVLKSITGEDGKRRRPTMAGAVTAEAVSALKDGDAEAIKEDPEKAARRAVQEAMKKKKKSRLEYRIQATRKMTGGKRIMPSGKEKAEMEVVEEEPEAGPSEEELQIGFAVASQECEESCGTCLIKVVRSGMVNTKCSVQFDTSDGDANSKDDYVSASGFLEFAPGETEKDITITIIDDNEWAPDKHFYVRLYGAKTEDEAAANKITLTVATTQITILNDDDPGTIEFEKKTFHAMDTQTRVDIPLKRKDGYDGNVLVFVKSIDGTAVAGEDYTPLPDLYEVHLDHNVREANVSVDLIKSEKTNVTFTLEITSVEPEGAKLGDNAQCTVIVSNDENYQKLMEDVVKMMDTEMDKYGVGTSSWSEQFHDAMNMGGDDGEEPETSDYVLHFLSFYWKVVHAFIPPTDLGGGWYTFWISLLYIGIITCFVGDAAKILGCCLGLEDGITAITFVALGTSLPDTFASVEATVSDDTADAAITNVTGSNSVNVFLGLGLPWTMAVIYHAANGTKFEYPAGDLNFSVLVFFGFALVCLVLLYVRRTMFGGELGGNKMVAYGSSGFLALSWLIYVVLSAMRTKGKLS